MRWWSPWIRRTGPVMVACAAVGIFAAVTLGAGPPAERAWAGRPCAGPAGVTRRGAPNGEWRQLTPRLDAEGALTGQHLAGGSRAGAGRGAQTDPGSVAGGPHRRGARGGGRGGGR